MTRRTATPNSAAPMPMPTLAPITRPLDLDVEAGLVAVEVELVVAVAWIDLPSQVIGTVGSWLP